MESSALESGASECMLVLISQPMLVLESSALESGASACLVLISQPMLVLDGVQCSRVWCQ